MSTPLTAFRPELRDRLLDLVWRQWTCAGLEGRAAVWSGIGVSLSGASRPNGVSSNSRSLGKAAL